LIIEISKFAASGLFFAAQCIMYRRRDFELSYRVNWTL